MYCIPFLANILKIKHNFENEYEYNILLYTQDDIKEQREYNKTQKNELAKYKCDDKMDINSYYYNGSINQDFIIQLDFSNSSIINDYIKYTSGIAIIDNNSIKVNTVNKPEIIVYSSKKYSVDVNFNASSSTLSFNNLSDNSLCSLAKRLSFSISLKISSNLISSAVKYSLALLIISLSISIP